MRSPFALLMVVLLGLGLTACGNSSGSASRTSFDAITAAGDTSSGKVASTTSSGGFSKSDGDKDNDDDPHGNRSVENDDRALLVSYGSDVSGPDMQAVTTLVKSYYTAATAEDGAKACALLSPSLAAGVAGGPGRSADGANSCASTVAALFKQQHNQLLADDVATMGVTEVRAKGNLGLAVLGFKRMPEGEVLIERDAGVWKIDSLLANNMT